MLLAEPISHTSIQYMNFVEIFSVSLNLSTICFAYFSRCCASFVLVVSLSYEAIACIWSQQTIALKMVDQGRSELHVVLTVILCGTHFFIWWATKLKFTCYL